MNKLFTLDVPECQELKATYDKCYNEWMSRKDSFQRRDELEKCQPFFQDYNDCVRVMMRERITKKKNEKS